MPADPVGATLSSEVRVRRMPWLVLVVAVAVLTGFACGGSDAPGGTSESTGHPVRPAVSAGVIAYSDVVGPEDAEDVAVYTIRADGTGAEQLIDYATAPAWSPDGNRFAVGQDGIALYDADGTNAEELGSGLGLCDEPAWSPDGSRIACIGPTWEDGSMSLTYDDPASLWLIELDTEDARRLLDVGGLSWGEYPDAASFSPDGTRLVFSDEAGLLKIIELGTGRVRSIGAGASPEWSPKGNAIAYSTGHAIVVSRPDGSDLRTIVTSRNTVQEPSWSPDAKQIVYAVFSKGLGWSRWGSSEGLRIVAAGGGPARLLTRSGFDPEWRPR